MGEVRGGCPEQPKVCCNFTGSSEFDNKYQKQVRDIAANTPARYNADGRRLYEASGCAGKIAVLAVRLDTYPTPKRSLVFYLGTNSTKILGKMRREILSSFNHLPTSGEYFHECSFRPDRSQ